MTKKTPCPYTEAYEVSDIILAHTVPKRQKNCNKTEKELIKPGYRFCMKQRKNPNV